MERVGVEDELLRAGRALAAGHAAWSPASAGRSGWRCRCARSSRRPPWRRSPGAWRPPVERGSTGRPRASPAARATVPRRSRSRSSGSGSSTGSTRRAAPTTCPSRCGCAARWTWRRCARSLARAGAPPRGGAHRLGGARAASPCRWSSPPRRSPSRCWTCARSRRERREAEALRPGGARRGGARSTWRAGPLLRSAAACGWARRSAALCFTLHHVVSDGWSMGVLVREVSALYGGLLARGARRRSPSWRCSTPTSPSGSGSGSRASGWTRSCASGARSWRSARRCWSCPRTTRAAAPWARPRRGAPFALSAERRAGLRELGRREGATLFMALLAGWQALLGRYAGQDDVVVGTPVANRTRARAGGADRLLRQHAGAARRTWRGDPTFRELLGRVRETTLGAFAHQDLPFERLVEELAPGAQPDAQPALPGDVRAPEHGRGACSPWAAGGGAAGGRRHRGQVRRRGDALRGRGADPGRDRLPHGPVRRPPPSSAWRSTSASCWRPPSPSPTAALSELRAAGRRGGAPAPGGVERAAAAPGRSACPAALRGAGGAHAPRDRRCRGRRARSRYAELDARSGRLAHALRALGVGPETPVARLPGARARGCWRPCWGSGRRAAPTCRWTPRTRRTAWSTCCATPAPPCSSRRSACAARCRATRAAVLLLDADAAAIAAGSRRGSPPWRSTRSSWRTSIYTSGSTGPAQGGARSPTEPCCTPCGAALARFGFAAGEEVPSLASFAFDIWLFEAVLPLLAGGAVRMVPREEVLETARLVEGLAGCTSLHAVPALMREVVRALRAAGRVLPRLRQAFVGGDAVAPDLLREMREVFPAAAVHVLYGPTEGAVICASHAAREGEPAAADGGPAAGQRRAVRAGPRRCSRCRWAFPASCASAGRAWRATTWAGRSRRRRSSCPTRSRRTGARACTARGTGCAGARRESWSSWDGSTRRSRSAASASSPARWRPCSPGTPGSATRPCWSATQPDGDPGEKRLVGYVVPAAGGGRRRPGAELPGGVRRGSGSRSSTTTYSGGAADADPAFNVVGLEQQLHRRAHPRRGDARVGGGRRGAPARAAPPPGAGDRLRHRAPALPPGARSARSTGAPTSPPPPSGYLRGQLARPGRELPGVRLLERAADDFSGIPGGASTWWWSTRWCSTSPAWSTCCGCWRAPSRRSPPGARCGWATCAACRCWRPSTPRWSWRRRRRGRRLRAARPRPQAGRAREGAAAGPGALPCAAGPPPARLRGGDAAQEGRHANEMTRFRYDVLLRVEAETLPRPRPRGAAGTSWASLEAVRRVLDEEAPEALAVSRVPNPRVAGALAVLDALAGDAEPGSAAELRALAAEREARGPDPEAFRALAEACGYRGPRALGGARRARRVRRAAGARRRGGGAPGGGTGGAAPVERVRQRPAGGPAGPLAPAGAARLAEGAPPGVHGAGRRWWCWRRSR